MRAWAEINIKNLEHNINIIKNISNNHDILGILKADAYGHGAIEISKILKKNGIKIFGVASVDEAIELRKNGIKDDILILGCVLSDEYDDIIKYNIIITVASFENIKNIEKYKIYPRIHIAIDTGMGRRGFFSEEFLKAYNYIKNNKIAKIEGIYSHFSVADVEEEKKYTINQLREFEKLTHNIEVKYKHISNSAGIINYLDKTNSNLIRPGIALYGINTTKKELDLRNVLKFKSRIVHLKKIDKPRYISYMKKYLAKEGEVIATISAGYADGVKRAFSNKGYVKIHNVKCKIVGLVCMDQFMVSIDSSIVDKVKLGDEVIIYDENISELASMIDTIPYELLTSLTKRVKRVYL
ncbi:alanine racemase [Hypnocyclicus thermotrophus]|uniref:Alanine racemase n=2 Tax=Hypnocyclicus thermotrophus TaxID=1627895 RepID=A0AA46I598_9FUSO|nr:alanine racemase [Hypnocyclicus thermotrophus]